MKHSCLSNGREGASLFYPSVQPSVLGMLNARWSLAAGALDMSTVHSEQTHCLPRLQRLRGAGGKVSLDRAAAACFSRPDASADLLASSGRHNGRQMNKAN